MKFNVFNVLYGFRAMNTNSNFNSILAERKKIDDYYKTPSYRCNMAGHYLTNNTFYLLKNY